METSGRIKYAIFVPIWNENEKILRRNRTMLNNLHKPEGTKVFWLLHSSQKNTIETARRLANKIEVIVDDLKPLKARALNNAIKIVNPEYALFLDVDTFIEGIFIVEGFKKIEELGVDVLQGLRCVDNLERNWVTRIQGREYHDTMVDDLYFRRMVVIHGSGVFLKVSTLNRLGGFPETIVEDYDLTNVYLKNKCSFAIFNREYFEEVTTNIFSLLKQRIRWYTGWEADNFSDRIKNDFFSLLMNLIQIIAMLCASVKKSLGFKSWYHTPKRGI